MRSRLRFVIGSLIRARSYSVAVVMTFAVAFAAFTAVVAAVDSIWFTDLRFDEDHELVTVWEYDRKTDATNSNTPMAYMEWRDQISAFSATAAYVSGSETAFDVTFPGGAERIRGAVVSAGFFHLLGIELARGRGFSRDSSADDQSVVLSHALWRSKFSHAENILGETVYLNDLPHTVIGVAPPWLSFPSGVDLWLSKPLSASRKMNVSVLITSSLGVVARLAPGKTIRDAEMEMASMAQGLRSHIASRDPAGVEFLLVPLREHLFGTTKRPLRIFLLGALLVLLLACCNISFMTLSRTRLGYHDLAIRASLGATKKQLVMHCLMEVVVLATVGVGLGMLLAVTLVDMVSLSYLPELETLGGTVSFGPRVFAVAASTVMIAVAVASIAPILLVLRVRPVGAVRGEPLYGLRKVVLFRLLPISEITLTVALFLNAGLVMRGLMKLTAVDVGVNPAATFKMKVTLTKSRYPSTEEQTAFFWQILEGIGKLPGVREVGGVNLFGPTDGAYGNFVTEVDDQPLEPLAVEGVSVTPGYFRAMGIPLRQGRSFHPTDRGGAPRVVVVSEALAKLLGLTENPVGKKITFETMPREIVGVAGSVRLSDEPGESTPKLYLPFEQSMLPWPFMTFVVRGDGDLASLVTMTRDFVTGLDPLQPISDVQTLASVVDAPLRRHRQTGYGLSALALVALFFAVVGIYGVTLFLVNARTRDYAIRMAVGANSRHVMAMILKESVLQGFVGVVAGLTAGRALSGVLASMLFEITAWDTPVVGTAVLVGLLVPVFSSLRPALLGASVDPARMLRGTG